MPFLEFEGTLVRKEHGHAGKRSDGKTREGANRPGASKNTVATYKRYLKKFAEAFGGNDAEGFTTADLSDFLFSVRLKEDGSEKCPRTMNSIKTALKSFFKSLCLKEDPAKKIRIKRVRLACNCVVP